VANFIYAKAKEAILNGQFNFNDNSFRVLFTTNLYTPNQSSHQYVSDIGPSGIAYRVPVLEDVSNSLGVVDASDVAFSLPANTAIIAMVFYQLGVSDSNSRLLFYIDTADGLPYPGSEEEVSVTIAWNNSSNKILSL